MFQAVALTEIGIVSIGTEAYLHEGIRPETPFPVNDPADPAVFYKNIAVPAIPVDQPGNGYLPEYLLIPFQIIPQFIRRDF